MIPLNRHLHYLRAREIAGPLTINPIVQLLRNIRSISPYLMIQQDDKSGGLVFDLDVQGILNLLDISSVVESSVVEPSVVESSIVESSIVESSIPDSSVVPGLTLSGDGVLVQGWPSFVGWLNGVWRRVTAVGDGAPAYVGKGDLVNGALVLDAGRFGLAAYSMYDQSYAEPQVNVSYGKSDYSEMWGVRTVGGTPLIRVQDIYAQKVTDPTSDSPRTHAEWEQWRDTLTGYDPDTGDAVYDTTIEDSGTATYTYYGGEESSTSDTSSTPSGA